MTTNAAGRIGTIPSGTGTPASQHTSTGIRLHAPVPGWSIDADVVVVGSGVAGLTVALRCAAAGARVTVVTKAHLDDGSTRWAQGGIAAALGEGDTPAQHLADTLVAGAGLCDEPAVRALVTDGPDAVRRLIATGALFDTGDDGAILLAREGGHHRRRIAHAGGDATGAEVSRALIAAVRAAGAPAPRTQTAPGTASRSAPGQTARAQTAPETASQTAPGEAARTRTAPETASRSAPGEAARTQDGGRIELIENALVLDLLTDAEGRTAGVTLHVMGAGQRDGVGAVRARAVVLATGGMGQVYSATTNPSVSTGDGVALALRAGAEVSDLEFVQFHPTVLWLGPDAEGQQPLVSEAVRGEGAHLVDADGTRFMLGQHELAELAPRDIVAKAIMRRMRETGGAHMYLDARHFGAQMWQERFPTILAACRAHGIDPVTEPIPVAPAAHYASGGVRTDLRGHTTVPGLYACGEVACTGVHGANRLASNSLLEGLVFAERIAADITAHPAAPGEPVIPAPAGSPLLASEARYEVQRIMTAGAGVLRSAESLATAAGALERLHTAAVEAYDREGKTAEPCVETWEATNLALVARVLVAAARRREETRGCHWREDRPDRDDEQWRRHLVVRLTPYRTLAVRTTEGPEFGDDVRDDGTAAPGAPAHPAAPGGAAAPQHQPSASKELS